VGDAVAGTWSWLGRHRSGSLLAGLGIVAVLVVPTSPTLSSVIRPVTAVVALALFARGMRLWTDSRSRVALALVGAGLTAGLVSGVLAAVNLAVTGHSADPSSPIDWIYLAYAPLIVAALLALPRRSPSVAGGLRAFGDALACAGALAFVLLVVRAIPNVVAVHLHGAAVIVTNAYAVLPAAVLATALSLRRQVVRRRREFLHRMTAAVALLGLVDIAYCVQTWRGTYRAASGVGAVDDPGRQDSGAVPAEPVSMDERALWTLVWPYLMAATAIAVAAYRTVRGESLAGPELLAVLTMLLAMVVRQLANGRRLQRLFVELSDRERGGAGAAAPRRRHRPAQPPRAHRAARRVDRWPARRPDRHPVRPGRGGHPQLQHPQRQPRPCRRRRAAPPSR